MLNRLLNKLLWRLANPNSNLLYKVRSFLYGLLSCDYHGNNGILFDTNSLIHRCCKVLSRMNILREEKIPEYVEEYRIYDTVGEIQYYFNNRIFCCIHDTAAQTLHYKNIYSETRNEEGEFDIIGYKDENIELT